MRDEYTRTLEPARKDNMGWSGWEEFRNLTPDVNTNLPEQEKNQGDGEASFAVHATRKRNAGRDRTEGLCHGAPHHGVARRAIRVRVTEG